MAQKYTPKFSNGKRRRRGSGALVVILISVLVLLAAACAGLLLLSQDSGGSGLQLFATEPPTDPPTEAPTEPPTEPPTDQPTEPPEPEHVVSRATIGATGDLLMHMPVVNTALQSDGSYNFEYIFQYIKSYTESVDWAVANLETTLAGSGRGYSGYPNFNSPDEIVDGVKNSGFDMLLTGNNHSYDTGESGFFRTIETVRSAGLETLGTMLTADEPKYAIEELNGIHVGMLSYTYQGIPDGAISGRVYLNGILLHEGAEDVVNTFIPSNLESFYTEVEELIAQMRDEGAEAIVIFLHWGVEYSTTPVTYQTEMAQKLCDLGVDVIVGGHPHVVEPLELLTSTVDSDHKTVCLYSMGNAVSNQRSEILGNAGYTEDGVWFTMTFCKYSDGTVYLESVDLIPCWVNLRTVSGRYYYILPLDSTQQDDWQELLELSDTELSAATRSYNRTMGIVGTGLETIQQYLTEAQELRDANYVAALYESLYGQDEETQEAAVQETETQETEIQEAA